MKRRIASEVLNVRHRIIPEKSAHDFPPTLDHCYMQRTASGLIAFIDQQITQLGFPQKLFDGFEFSIMHSLAEQESVDAE
jgi:hypothetical protein